MCVCVCVCVCVCTYYFYKVLFLTVVNLPLFILQHSGIHNVKNVRLIRNV